MEGERGEPELKANFFELLRSDSHAFQQQHFDNLPPTKGKCKKSKLHDSTLVARPPHGILPQRISEAVQTCGVHLRRFRSLRHLQPPA